MADALQNSGRNQADQCSKAPCPEINAKHKFDSFTAPSS